MTLRKALMLSGFLLFLAAPGCGGRDADSDDAAAGLRDWIGLSDRTLVLKWGAPDAVYDMKNGNRLLTWRRDRTERQGGEVYTVTETQIIDGQKVVVPITRQTPKTTVRYVCVTSFEVDRAGYVVGQTTEGNDCLDQPRPY